VGGRVEKVRRDTTTIRMPTLQLRGRGDYFYVMRGKLPRAGHFARRDDPLIF